jgi:ribosome recycling factor
VRHEALATTRKREKSRLIGADDARREAAELQRLTDRFVEQIDARGEAKVAALMRL